jgi:hypothetical protein
MVYILKEKLKGLKTHIKEWNKETYGEVDVKLSNLISDIKNLDIRSEVSGLSEGDVVLRKNLFAQFWHLKTNKESVLSQRSRIRWLKYGNENSRYFHACLKSSGKRNFIRALRVGEVWCETPLSIRNAIVEYFSLHFAADHWSTPKLDGIVFPLLGEDENRELIIPFSLEEIEIVVMESDGNKSPGSDEFNFAFVKAMWSLI